MSVPLHRRRTFAWTLVGTALGLVLLYAATRRVDAGAVVSTLRTADVRCAFSVLALAMGFVAVKAWRWCILLRLAPGVSWRELHGAVYVGLAANFVLAHVGELVRAGLVARARRVAISTVLASVVVERVLDFVALLALLLVVSLLATELPGVIEAARVVTALLVAVSIIAIYALVRPPRWLRRLASFAGRRLPEGARRSCLRHVDLSRQGFESIATWQLMLVAAVLSVVQWSLIVAAIWCSALAAGETIGLVAAAVIFVLIVLGLSLPSSPMQVGTTQLAFTIGFAVGGHASTPAIAASVVYTLFLILPVMFGGAAYLLAWRGRQG